MKTILIFSLICFTLSVWGPVDKIKNSNSERTCGLTSPDSPSDCVDLNLKFELDDGKNLYADRCCYVRYQEEGIIKKICVPLPEENYLDITETIKEFEKNWDDDRTDGKKIKVYQFDCAASNIKFLSIASLLLALLF